MEFANVEVRDVDFSRQRFEMLTASATTFVRCDFSRVSFRSQVGLASTSETRFVGCRFDGADLRALDLLAVPARFEDCSFRRARIKSWRAWCSEFVGCTFEGRIEDVIFSGRPVRYEFLGPEVVDMWSRLRPRNEFRDNDFRAADLVGVDFKFGIDLDLQRLPDGPGYVRFDRWAERTASARRRLIALPASKARTDALFVLEIHAKSGYEEQSTVLFREPVFASRGEEARRLVREAIEEG